MIKIKAPIEVLITRTKDEKTQNWSYYINNDCLFNIQKYLLSVISAIIYLSYGGGKYGEPMYPKTNIRSTILGGTPVPGLTL